MIVMRIYDISMQIDENTIIYPGDMKVKIHKVKSSESDQWNLSELCLGAHTGTHLDTPLHVANEELNASEIALEKCCGQALVLDLTHISLGELITKNDIEETTKEFGGISGKIILLKTMNSKYGYREFRSDWVELSLEAAKFLTEKGIKAVGIDCLTIGEYSIHRELLLHGILVYEGLVLQEIHPKQYFFAGFPLKLVTEGSFVRAVLIDQL